MMLQALWAMPIVVLLTSCGGSDTTDTSNGVISANPAKLSFSGPSPMPQNISISYAVPPTQIVLAGFPANGINPTCIGTNATCRLSMTLVSASNANPLVYSVTILNTASSHTSTLRFVSTDAAYQINYGYIDISVTHTP
jgi:hypothetical protein